jgi:uncharacterized protein (DUF1778 family)
MVAKTMKDDRLDLRLSNAHKTLIEEAAALSGQPVTTFVVSTLVEHATAILKKNETTVLSKRDREVFLKILDEAEPAAELRKAARRFKARHA